MADNVFEEIINELSTEEVIIFSTIRDVWFLVLIATGIMLWVVYIMYKILMEKEYKFFSYNVLLTWAILVCSVLILLILRIVSIEIVQGGKNVSFIFLLLVGILMMPYMTACSDEGFSSDNKIIRYLSLVVIIYIALGDFGQIGMRVTFNIDIYIAYVFSEKTFQNNSPQGIDFMLGNVTILIVIFGATVIAEKIGGK